jgi:hypothetical protein
MLKNKIFEKCKKYFEDYLFGFDEDHMEMSLLSGHINLNNVNVRPDKINEAFAKSNLPIALKAGLISKLSIDVSPAPHNATTAQHLQAFLGRLQTDRRRCALRHWTLGGSRLKGRGNSHTLVSVT